MKRAIKPKTEEKTSAKRSGKTEGKKTGKKDFNGFKTEGPKPAEEINLDLSGYPEDEKGNKVVPVDIFEANYKLLPNGTRCEDGRLTVNGGILKPLGSDPESDKDIHRKGGEALQAMHKQRQSLSDAIDVLLRKKIPAELAEQMGIEPESTWQDAANIALLQQVVKGNVKAYATMRDTAGEMPVAKQEITADLMTAADRALMEKLQRRLDQ